MYIKHIIYLYAIISDTMDSMIWLIYGIMCIPYLRVYAMFCHRNHVSLDYVLYYSLIHRERYNSIDTSEEQCIFMLTVPFSLLYSNIIVVISPTSRKRKPAYYVFPRSFVSIFWRIVQTVRWLAGKYRLYKWGTDINSFCLLLPLPLDFSAKYGPAASEP